MAADGNARPQFKYSHQAGATATTQIKTGPGTLRSIVINTVGATVSPIVLADSATGGVTPVIATITPVATSTVIPSSGIYDIAFLNGLTFTMSTASNTQDVTISYI